MSKALQKIMKTRLRALKEIAEVTVTVSEDLGQINISHKLHHVADFRFTWVDGNHYVGYFVPASGEPSQAVIALWTPFEAVKFLVLYSSMVELRAKRERPET